MTIPTEAKTKNTTTQPTPNQPPNPKPGEAREPESKTTRSQPTPNQPTRQPTHKQRPPNHTVTTTENTNAIEEFMVHKSTTNLGTGQLSFP